MAATLLQAATVTTATTATAVAVPSTPPAPAAVGSPRAAVVEVSDDDVPPPGSDQWASLPASAPKGLDGGARGEGRWWSGTRAPSRRRRGLVVARRTCGMSGAGVGACRRAAGPLRRGSGGAGAVAGAP
jgi:hypothetical protein